MPRELIHLQTCSADGLALVDASTASWRMLHANDAFRSATHMPNLLAGGGDAVKAGPPTPVDFWAVFGHVTDSTRDFWKVSRVCWRWVDAQLTAQAWAGPLLEQYVVH
jgi:hypothetical protein